MQNHFHFLVQANTTSTALVKETPIKVNALTEGIRMMLSSYTKAIQKQELITGNLFQQKTKCKCVDEYSTTVFHYIHQNPLKAGLVQCPEDWKWSSLREYLELSTIEMCKKKIAFSSLDIKKENLLKDSCLLIREEPASGII